MATLLREAVKFNPVIVLTGARQVGKSTLLRNEPPFSEWKYLSLDDYDILKSARENPEALLSSSARLVIDEVQKAPGLLEAVKLKVDTSPGSRFILSGSSNLLLMNKVSESLAGRAAYFELNPLCFGEIENLPYSGNLEKLFGGRFRELNGGAGMTKPDHFGLMWKGFMPPLIERESGAAVLQWWEGYVRTYLERDLRQVAQIDSLPDYRRLMSALALQTGGLLNQTALSRDLGMSQPTAHRYINLLETTNLLKRIPAYTVNRRKRLVKSPRVMWIDPGLAAFLSGLYSVPELKSSRHAGGIFEALVYLHLDTYLRLMTPRPGIYFWRTSDGKEVDFIIEWGSKLIAVEAKLSDTVRFADADMLRLFMQEYPETKAGLLLYAGNEIEQMEKNIFAIPWYVL